MKKFRRNRKLVSILVTLSFLVAMLVPMVGPAGAATEYELVTKTVTFDPDQASAKNLKLAAFRVVIDPYEASLTSAALIEVVDGQGKTLPINSVNGISVNEKTYNYTFVPTGNDKEKYWQTLELNIDASDANPGEVKAKFLKTSNQLVGGSITLANAKGGMVEASVPTVSAISDAGCTPNSQNAIKIRLDEAVGGGFEVDSESVKLKLPTGFEWNGARLNVLNNAALNDKFDYSYADDGRTLRISAAAHGGTALLEITAGVKVDSTVAKLGDVEVKISGESTVTPTEIIVASYGDYEATVEEVTTKVVMSGQLEQEIGKFAICEQLPGTLVKDRTILLTLPEPAKWNGDFPKISNGDSKHADSGVLTAFTAVGTDNRSIKATVKEPTTGDEPTKIVFKGGEITVRADYTGDIKLTVEGSAGVDKDEVLVAEAKAPVTATASSLPEVIIGMGSQVASELTITETKEEALQAKYDTEVTQRDKDGFVVWVKGTADAYLSIETPPGVRFASVPTFTTTEDIQLGDPITDIDDNRVDVRVRSTSSKPASIKISDLKLIVDRTVPEGEIRLKIGGDALVENDINGLFPNVEWVERVAVAKVITPAPEETKATTVFTINDTNYTVNGVEKTMDVAPYIKGDRTYMPIRFAAQAAGVSDANIIWDANERSVVLIKGDRVVKLVIDSNVMMINGVAFTMDVAPEIVDPGRTMLPVRWVAQALGCSVDWDEVTQTVTIN